MFDGVLARGAVAGTMCAASPARNSRPWRIGSATNDRIGAIPLSKISPSWSAKEPSSVAMRVWSSSQMRASGHASSSSSGATWR